MERHVVCDLKAISRNDFHARLNEGKTDLNKHVNWVYVRSENVKGNTIKVSKKHRLSKPHYVL